MLCIPEGKEVEAHDFYANKLGLQELENKKYSIPKDAIWFQIGDIQLHIRAENQEIAHSQRHAAFIIENLEAVKSYTLNTKINYLYQRIE